MTGVLFGYAKIFMKVSGVKLQLRQHQQRVLDASANFAGTASEGIPDSQSNAKRQRQKKPGYTRDDVKLAKTLFAAFIVFLICWYAPAYGDPGILSY